MLLYLFTNYILYRQFLGIPSKSQAHHVNVLWETTSMPAIMLRQHCYMGKKSYPCILHDYETDILLRISSSGKFPNFLGPTSRKIT